VTHPITPPPELVQQWLKERTLLKSQPLAHTYLATRAAQWGADQELEACLRLVEIDAGEDAYDFARYIRAARRPKPPSLKEQALKRLERIERLVADLESNGLVPFHDKDDTIRRALEQLDD
jgi:hypothetical protein